MGRTVTSPACAVTQAQAILEERAAAIRQDSLARPASEPGSAAAPSSGPSIGRRVLRAARRPPRGTTFLVWCAAIALLFQLAAGEIAGLHVVGYVEARSYEVASLTVGRVGAVVAQLQQEVAAGEVLATMDSTDNDLALQAATAELGRLRAERTKASAALAGDAADRATAHRAELRRFTADSDQARIELLQTETQLAVDTSELARLNTELERLQRLGDELVAPEREEDKRLQRATLEARIASYRGLLGEQRARHEKARQRAEEFARSPQPLADPTVELAPFDQAIAAQEARIAQLRVAQAGLVLRAPTAGRVAAILRRSGEIVAAGEPVVTVIEREPSAVVAHLPEEFLQRVALGTQATIYRHGNRAEAFEAVVVHTGAEVERMPRRADASSPIPRWGFPVHLSCPPGRNIVAGEEFAVVFRGPAGSPTPSAP